MLQPQTQIELFPESGKALSAERKMARTGTFTDNMKLSVHRWFRYSAGFSADWVIQEIAEHQKSCHFVNILDPFAGSGTTLLAAEAVHVHAVGFESHPFIYRVAKAKLNWNVDTTSLRTLYREIIAEAKAQLSQTRERDVPLLKKCFSGFSLNRLDSIKDVFLSKYDNGHPENELVWLGITGIIRPCSSAGTAQWQYVLPNKKKSKVVEPFEAFMLKMEQIIEDVSYAKQQNWLPTSKIIKTDARKPIYDDSELFDLVITSPPYPNNFDYADATRLEMTFWGEINGWSELHSSVRKFLLRSCSQHSAKEKLILCELLQHKVLAPIRKEITKSCNELSEIRKTKGGRKTYHTMAAAYFIDLGNTFHELRRLCKNGSRLCFVIGDSAPYGVYLPVDKWLGELAISAGFRSYTFEKIRDRNIKWKNRKHRVPLHEGRLWIEG